MSWNTANLLVEKWRDHLKPVILRGAKQSTSTTYEIFLTRKKKEPKSNQASRSIGLQETGGTYIHGKGPQDTVILIKNGGTIYKTSPKSFSK